MTQSCDSPERFDSNRILFAIRATARVAVLFAGDVGRAGAGSPFSVEASQMADAGLVGGQVDAGHDVGGQLAVGADLRVGHPLEVEQVFHGHRLFAFGEHDCRSSKQGQAGDEHGETVHKES